MQAEQTATRWPHGEPMATHSGDGSVLHTTQLHAACSGGGGGGAGGVALKLDVDDVADLGTHSLIHVDVHVCARSVG